MIAGILDTIRKKGGKKITRSGFAESHLNLKLERAPDSASGLFEKTQALHAISRL